MDIVLFGLTGGVASGKSTVARRFRQRGVQVIDADALARDVVAPGSEGLAEVATAFGADVLSADGRLDRGRLGEIVFADSARRERLNGILHPRIRAATRARAEALAGQGERLACYEAALLVENELADTYRPLVVAAAPRPVQLARLMERDGLDVAAATARLDAQLPLADKVRVADFVIDTSGSLSDTCERADVALDGVIEAIAAAPTGAPQDAPSR